MIRIQQLTLPVGHTEIELEQKIRRELRLRPEDTLSCEIRKRSVDARKKPELYFSYVIDCHVKQEQKIYKRADKRKVSLVTEKAYQFPKTGTGRLSSPPVIIGTGPAGLFCGLMLAKHGYRPILLERGRDVDSRMRDVAAFWETGRLNPESNVQFGEGGAGTFSDGKLNTLVKDKDGRNREVLRIFVKAGADPSILYDSKPHIGTDVLIKTVKNIREQIIGYGGTVRFGAQVTGIRVRDGRLTGLVINDTEEIDCDTAVFAIGHSARNTFQTLYDSGLHMESKEFAAGFRVEHLQKDINLIQYGREDVGALKAAPYKVTAKAANGRSVYSFCMCPGGYVVNASSEEGRLAVNGMSYSGRNGRNANSAIIVSVYKSDFPSEHPLAGIAFQRQLEEAAYRAGGGRIPVQRLGDFCSLVERRRGVQAFGAYPLQNQRIMSSASGVRFTSPDISAAALYQPDLPAAAPHGLETGSQKPSADAASALQPCMKGGYTYGDLTGILPPEMTDAFLDGMEQFSHKIRGFADRDVLISAVESRTSSPVRILRDETFQSNIKGLYPCGEGAGYAGGITSAAMDGLRIAEAIAKKGE